MAGRKVLALATCKKGFRPRVWVKDLFSIRQQARHNVEHENYRKVYK